MNRIWRSVCGLVKGKERKAPVVLYKVYGKGASLQQASSGTQEGGPFLNFCSFPEAQAQVKFSCTLTLYNFRGHFILLLENNICETMIIETN